MPTKSYHRVPHDDLTETPIHVNYRLFGSIPYADLKALQDTYQQLLQAAEHEFSSRSKTPDRQREFALAKEQIQDDYEAEYDELLDTIRSGPTWLHRKDIAQIVYDSWLTLQERMVVTVLACCIMPNHVHVILQNLKPDPLPLGHPIGSHKKYTARRANVILDRVDLPFWAEGYFDRTIRPGRFASVLAYVLRNPVKARLVTDWKDWPFTYVNPVLEEEYL